MQNKIQFVLLLLLASNQISAQQDAVAAGGDTFSTSNGSVSYSIGQINFTDYTNTNFNLTNGIQQAYEIYSLDIESPIFIKFNVLVYPNPTDSDVILRINQNDSLELSYQVFDVQGKFLLQNKITEQETKISLNNYSSGTYILKVLSKDSSFKHFKIIKK